MSHSTIRTSLAALSVSAAFAGVANAQWQVSGTNQLINNGWVTIGANGFQSPLFVFGNWSSGVIRAENYGPTGPAFVGFASNTTSFQETNGILGFAANPGGVGARGWSIGVAGKGVWGTCTGYLGYAGYFEGRGYFSTNVAIGDTNAVPANGTLYVATGNDIRSGGYVQIGSHTGSHMVIDDNEIECITNAGAHSPLGLNTDGGGVAINGGAIANYSLSVLNNNGSSGRVYLNGGLDIGVTGGQEPIDVVGGAYCTGPNWINGSSRTIKEGFAPVNGRDVLDRVAALPMTTWTYKAGLEKRRGEAAGAQPSIRHMGPMAEDFAQAFGLGDSDKAIGTVDEGGVALAAIQGLNSKLETQVATLRQENQDLRARLDRLEAALKTAK